MWLLYFCVVVARIELCVFVPYTHKFDLLFGISFIIFVVSFGFPSKHVRFTFVYDWIFPTPFANRNIGAHMLKALMIVWHFPCHGIDNLDFNNIMISDGGSWMLAHDDNGCYWLSKHTSPHWIDWRNLYEAKHIRICVLKSEIYIVVVVVVTGNSEEIMSKMTVI